MGNRHAAILTVGRLKELLASVPDDYRVCTEGCDCVGPSDDIEVDDKDKVVTVNRNDDIDNPFLGELYT